MVDIRDKDSRSGLEQLGGSGVATLLGQTDEIAVFVAKIEHNFTRV